MTSVTFDTLELTTLLRDSGIEQQQTEAIVKTIAHAQDSLITKVYLDLKFEKELSPVRTDLAALKWMMAALLATNILLVIKAFL